MPALKEINDSWALYTGIAIKGIEVYESNYVDDIHGTTHIAFYKGKHFVIKDGKKVGPTHGYKGEDGTRSLRNMVNRPIGQGAGYGWRKVPTPNFEMKMAIVNAYLEKRWE
jgi:hypothetical protein